MYRLITVAALTASLASHPLAAETAGFLPYTDSAALAAGAALYAEQCAACHGAELEGAANWRDRDAEGYLPAPPHDETGHTWHHPDRQLFLITKYGTEALVGGSYKSRMLGFEDVLTDIQILEVLAYIKSTWPQQVIDMHDDINANAAEAN